jgi:hypothetical protein
VSASPSGKFKPNFK